MLAKYIFLNQIFCTSCILVIKQVKRPYNAMMVSAKTFEDQESWFLIKKKKTKVNWSDSIQMSKTKSLINCKTIDEWMQTTSLSALNRI